MGNIIDGAAIAREIRETLKHEAARMTAAGSQPGLGVILVGDNPASHTYVRSKRRACLETGIYSEVHLMPAETTQRELLAKVAELAANPAIHGILVQMPLPAHLDDRAVLAAIPPEKDVDGLTPENSGLLYEGHSRLVPCTPKGIIALLDYCGVSIDGKRCVVIGRSRLVGKPAAMLLLERGGTVTLCHSHTLDLGEVTRRSDIIVAAVGRRGLITADMVSPGAVVIDVAMNRDDAGKLCGDVDFEAVKEKAALITPVPGGVGPMTIAMLLANTIIAAKGTDYSLKFGERL